MTKHQRMQWEQTRRVLRGFLGCMDLSLQRLSQGITFISLPLQRLDVVLQCNCTVGLFLFAGLGASRRDAGQAPKQSPILFTICAWVEFVAELTIFTFLAT